MGKTRRIHKFWAILMNMMGYGLHNLGWKQSNNGPFKKNLVFTSILYFFFHKLANDILNIIYIFPLNILITFRTLIYLLKG